MRLCGIVALVLAFGGVSHAQLVLSDFVVPDGHETIMAGLIESGGGDANIYDRRTGQTQRGNLIDGSLSIIDTGVTINRVRSLPRFVLIGRAARRSLKSLRMTARLR